MGSAAGRRLPLGSVTFVPQASSRGRQGAVKPTLLGFTKALASIRYVAPNTKPPTNHLFFFKKKKKFSLIQKVNFVLVRCLFGFSGTFPPIFSVASAA